MRRPPIRAIRALRALAAWVAVVLVAAQLGNIGHHVLVAHYLCAEHGTLHHGSAPEARSADCFDGETAAPASEGDHGSHDDCATPVRTPPEALTAASPTVHVAESVAVIDIAPGTETSAHTSIALLALAPKQGPPRA